MLFNLICLLQPFIVNSAFLIVDGCNTFSNQDSCINNYGCGWCNTTNLVNDSLKETVICREIDICPISEQDNNEICTINRDYYYKFNCFLSKFIIYSLLIFGFLMIMAGIYIAILYNMKNPPHNTINNYGLISCITITICIMGACLLFVNDFIFSNFIFVLVIIALIFSCVSIRKRNRRISYYDTENNEHLLYVNNEDNHENPPLYGKN